jgi:hypothetical protein
MNIARAALACANTLDENQILFLVFTLAYVRTLRGRPRRSSEASIKIKVGSRW